MSIEFKDPPAPKARGGAAHGRTVGMAWAARLGPLLEHPDRWAVVYTAKDGQNAMTTVSRLRASQRGLAWAVRSMGQLPEGRWEFAYDADTGQVFAKYLGAPNV